MNITYDAAMKAKDLLIGVPISVDGDNGDDMVDATVTAIIFDDARSIATVQARTDDGRTITIYPAYDDSIDVGFVTQYGILRPGNDYVTPVHTGHGPAGRLMALDSIKHRGGVLMVRNAVPCDSKHGGPLSGGIALDDFRDAA